MLCYKLTVYRKPRGKHEYFYDWSLNGIVKLCEYCLLLGKHGYKSEDIELELIEYE